ncbi:hypothetical protein CDAR_403311 [Caerostris darwini]|uniref:Uncharacterized protein n=1 Tax=Caerostris darwini TaxID=1538125 RepID=A0AAV4S9R6_9ARAC|nr:hypothetical protein CDAR_403311 [Caerostris darwini]
MKYSEKIYNPLPIPLPLCGTRGTDLHPSSIVLHPRTTDLPANQPTRAPLEMLSNPATLLMDLKGHNPLFPNVLKERGCSPSNLNCVLMRTGGGFVKSMKAKCANIVLTFYFPLSKQNERLHRSSVECLQGKDNL